MVYEGNEVLRVKEKNALAVKNILMHFFNFWLKFQNFDPLSGAKDINWSFSYFTSSYW